MALDKPKLLKKQLNRLPASLPSPPIQQSSYQWHLDSDFLNNEGIVAATNQMLERVMGMRASRLTLHERGKGILGVVEVLNTALKDEPDNSIIEKWIDDITEVAKWLCPGENVSSVIDVDESPKSDGPASKKVNSNSSNGDKSQKKPKLKKAAPKPKQSALNTMLPPKMAVVPTPVTKAATGPVSNDGVNGPENHSDLAYNPKTDLTYDDPRFLDLAELEVDQSKGGAIPDEDRLAATIHCRALEGSDAGKEFVQCLGSFKCNGIWVWLRRKDRILKHLSTCQYIPATLQKSSSKKQGDKAPIAMLEKRKAEDDQIEKEVERSASKKRCGKVAEKETSQPSLVLDLAHDTGRKEMKETLDNDVVMLICMAGLPPRIADLQQWKTLFNHATRGLYKPASKDILRDNHIPAMASWVCKKQIKYLKTQSNLTGTYDGSATRRPQSIYTFHVTDSHRCTFLIEGDESSTVSHTGEHISSIHQQHIFNLQDAVHEQQLTILEITKLEEFEETIEIVRRLLQFFRHSTAGTNHLRNTLDKFGISRGLEAIGNTRFATVYYACNSVLRCLPALYQLIGADKTIELTQKEDNCLFVADSRGALNFKLELQKLVRVLRPFALSIKCLESAHSTPADVFIYWFGVMTEYKEIFSTNTDELKKKTILEIRGIINRRYLGMVKDGPLGDVYITSFFLKPRYRDAAALNQPDPLRRTFVLRKKTGNDDQDLISSVPIRKETFLRIGKFLCKVLLRREYSQPPSALAALPDVLKGLDPEFASADLTQQLVTYAKRDYPFNLPIVDSECPLIWWKKLQYHSQASLLALLSICANSMADERTMSKVTKLNTHLRNRQEVQTLVDMIQIASYTTFNPEAPPPPK
ncbi:hypothetical protein FS837_012651 [Tulasnella sp. UAMH 9824]|nr:hypothetical protein FS837_012651 [Tulasnella sp. UAMH 9824]